MRRALVVGFALLAGCPKLGGRVGPRARADATADATVADTGAPPPILDAAPEDTGPPPIDASDDPKDLHKTTTADLLQILPYGGDTKYMAFSVGPVVGKMSQGNQAIARHAISRACLEGLRGVVLQTEEQRALRRGQHGPHLQRGQRVEGEALHRHLRVPEPARASCRSCGPPAQAKQVCQLEGKRLCTQEEWNLACRGDPEGGADRMLRLRRRARPRRSATRTSRAGRTRRATSDVKTRAWKTCSTDTEPSGRLPVCRSRFGVFDQHGNVAEIMTRKAGDGRCTRS